MYLYKPQASGVASCHNLIWLSTERIDIDRGRDQGIRSSLRRKATNRGPWICNHTRLAGDPEALPDPAKAVRSSRAPGRLSPLHSSVCLDENTSVAYVEAAERTWVYDKCPIRSEYALGNTPPRIRSANAWIGRHVSPRRIWCRSRRFWRDCPIASFCKLQREPKHLRNTANRFVGALGDACCPQA